MESAVGNLLINHHENCSFVMRISYVFLITFATEPLFNLTSYYFILQHKRKFSTPKLTLKTHGIDKGTAVKVKIIIRTLHLLYQIPSMSS